jgi:osmotically-inducible protein OsmY
MDSPDARLARDVQDKLLRNPQLPDAPSIVVTAEGGRILLEGWVGSVNARTLAEADARTVAGVVSVDDRLLIRRP